MTVSQKELVALIENNWQQHQQAKLEDRKVLEWSRSIEEHPDQHNSLSDDVRNSVISPMGHNDDIDDPSKSFNNDSSAFYDESEQLTPSNLNQNQPKAAIFGAAEGDSESGISFFN